MGVIACLCAHRKLGRKGVCFSLPPIAGQEQFGEERTHFIVCTYGISGREPGGRSCSRPWRSTAYWVGQPAILYHSGPPAQGRHHSQWPGPLHMIIEKISIGQSARDFLPIQVSSSQKTGREESSVRGSEWSWSLVHRGAL